MGLTKDDLHAIEGLSDVAKAEGGFSQDMLLNIDDNQKVLHVMSIPKSMNGLTVSEGRMPEKEGECLVDIDFFHKNRHLRKFSYPVPMLEFRKKMIRPMLR